MGMYEIPRNVKGERKNFNDFFYESTYIYSGLWICRIFNISTIFTNKFKNSWNYIYDNFCINWFFSWYI